MFSIFLRKGQKYRVPSKKQEFLATINCIFFFFIITNIYAMNCVGQYNFIYWSKWRLIHRVHGTDICDVNKEENTMYCYLKFLLLFFAGQPVQSPYNRSCRAAVSFPNKTIELQRLSGLNFILSEPALLYIAVQCEQLSPGSRRHSQHTQRTSCQSESFSHLETNW